MKKYRIVETEIYNPNSQKLEKKYFVQEKGLIFWGIPSDAALTNEEEILEYSFYFDEVTTTQSTTYRYFDSVEDAHKVIDCVKLKNLSGIKQDIIAYL